MIELPFVANGSAESGGISVIFTDEISESVVTTHPKPPTRKPSKSSLMANGLAGVGRRTSGSSSANLRRSSTLPNGGVNPSAGPQIPTLQHKGTSFHSFKLTF